MNTLSVQKVQGGAFYMYLLVAELGLTTVHIQGV